MKKPTIIIFIVYIALLTACSSTRKTGSLPEIENQPSETILSTISSVPTKVPSIVHISTVSMSPTLAEPTATIVVSTATPTITPKIPTLTAIQTDTPEVGYKLKNQCREILPVLPTDANPQGIMVISSPDGLSLEDFKGKVNREIPGLISYPATSPDGKWLAYTIFANDKPEMLVVETSDGQKKYQTPTGQGWLTFTRGFWLNNQQLWFPEYPLPGQITPIVVLNPFTDEQLEFPSNYPGATGYQYSTGGGAGLHFDYSSVVIDSSLNRVIYPQLDEKKGYLISLWDRQSQKVLVSLLDGGSYGYLPIWLPDGSQFVVVARSKVDTPKEWFIVSRDGQHIRQLTYFEEQFSNFEIENNASISPNGRYLAFGLSLPKDDNDILDTGNLVILDLETLDAVNSCIPIWESGVLVWSLDSRYIIVGEPWANDKSASSIIVLDMEQGWAAQVVEGWRFSPVGWMASP